MKRFAKADRIAPHTMKKKEEKDYEPFGEEWEKSVMQIPKKAIVELLRQVGKDKSSLDEVLVNAEIEIRNLNNLIKKLTP